GLGTFVGPVTAGALQQHLSWQATMQLFALGILLLGGVAAWAIRARPQELGLLPDGDRVSAAAGAPVETGLRRRRHLAD
ncbi:hypothetical protein ACEN8K_47550, partial [Variovorax sp. CT11-76]